MVWIILSWTLSPKLLLELFIYVEDDWANRAIREGLIRPEDKIPLVQMRIRTAVARSIIINRAEIVLQKRTGLVSEDGPFSFGSICEKLGMELIDTQPKMLGKPTDIHRLQERMNFLTAIGTFGTVDFPRYFAIEMMDCRVNAPTGENRSLEETAECPIGLLALFRELFNSLNIRFESHIP
jgi:hypothetical protein